jgi:hypothetical protein
MSPENVKMSEITQLKERQWNAIMNFIPLERAILVVTERDFLSFKFGSGVHANYAPIADLRGLL